MIQPEALGHLRCGVRAFGGAGAEGGGWRREATREGAHDVARRGAAYTWRKYGSGIVSKNHGTTASMDRVCCWVRSWTMAVWVTRWMSTFSAACHERKSSRPEEDDKARRGRRRRAAAGRRDRPARAGNRSIVAGEGAG